MNCTPIVRHGLTIGGAFFMAKFSSKEKIQAVKRYLDGSESGETIAKSIGVTPVLLREWIRQYEFQVKRPLKSAIHSTQLSIN